MTTGYFSCNVSICRHCGVVKVVGIERRVGRFPFPVSCSLLPVTRSGTSEIYARPSPHLAMCGIALLLADERWGQWIPMKDSAWLISENFESGKRRTS